MNPIQDIFFFIMTWGIITVVLVAISDLLKNPQPPIATAIFTLYCLDGQRKVKMRINRVDLVKTTTELAFIHNCTVVFEGWEE